MKKINNITTLVFTHYQTMERVLWIFLIATFACLVALYMYFVGHAAYAASDIKVLAREAVRVEGELASLEARYHSAREQVTRAVALEKGLFSYQNPTYASVSSGKALSIEVR
ncbi:MAG: hypothetical protein Q8Q18_00415 [bacterium]|nr:hypothetical protein [bacterium]